MGKISGNFVWSCRSANGRLKWADSIPNGTTFEGVTNFLGYQFTAAPQSATWYMGLIDFNSYTGLSTSDTYASHPGWVEWTFYTGNRPAWVPAVASGGVVATVTPSQWVMTSAGNLKGVFLTNSSTKGPGSGPVLYAQAVRSSPRLVGVGDTIDVTYAIRIQEP